MSQRVQVIGGGLAGLTLGIGLRQRDIPVTISEAGRYPRHRVCGEFISGEGLNVLSRLGLTARLEQAGAPAAQTAAFFDRSAGTPPLLLPQPARCISRHTLDHLLATEFRRLGGELVENRRADVAPRTESFVRATGRRAQSGGDGFHWFGLKAHARNVALTADLEMHGSERGYVGLCRVDGGDINVCGLFRREKGHERTPENVRDWLRGEPGTPLHQRLGNASFHEDSICSVAGISLRPRTAQAHDDCCVGDAITMIPPLTGNGMSMAFESAEIAIEPLVAWSRQEASWTETSQVIARKCDTAFASRLRWANRLQRCVFTPGLQRPLRWLTGHNGWFWRWCFARTR
jgi:2-polyprenyl-6-methoxyphenol hydroxylase-like FAD-dependent oxidoreductase